MFSLFLYKLINHIKVKLRKNVFKIKTTTNHNDFTLYGDVNLLNTDVKIGHNVQIYPNVTFWGNGHIEIGDNCSIGMGTVIFASDSGGVIIGNHTHIAGQCYIIDMDHGIKADSLIEEQDNSVEKITIEDDVWISAGAKILKGSVLRNHSVIGANAVVKGEIPENGVAVGMPAKVIKYRS